MVEGDQHLKQTPFCTPNVGEKTPQELLWLLLCCSFHLEAIFLFDIYYLSVLVRLATERRERE